VKLQFARPGSSGIRVVALVGLLALSLPVVAQEKAPTPVERSNENARVLIQVFSRFAPEGAGRLGVDGLDAEIFDLKPELSGRAIRATEDVIGVLGQRLASEKDPFIRQDLEILIGAAERNIEGTRLGDKYDIPYFDLPQTIFGGIRALLDDQVPAERRAKALVRLNRYAGLEAGYMPIAKLAEDRIRERLETPGLSAPFKDQLEKDLGNGPRFIGGIGQLFEKYKIAGYEVPYTLLKSQLSAYEKFVRASLLPRARADFKLPAEQYTFALKQSGIDMPVEELTSRARVAFKEIQNEMQALVPLVAKERGWDLKDYRDVIRQLKKEQISGDRIYAFYETRIKQIEKLIADNHVVTLPARQMRMRLASEAESAATPAPNMRPPRMLGNTGEMGEFVLPLRIPGKGGEKEIAFDDFTFAAASWTLTAHEARPGHELQFASVVEHGVSTARALFAINSVNVEGWGLYAEAEMKPYFPLDGQLGGLQGRLTRAARAILDPGLQMGTITREEATRMLREDVVLSEAMTLQEVERYTFWAPGQAPSYFCGYQRLMELRADAERKLGSRFDRQKFNDFILSQGMLPPALLRKAVLEDFIPSQKAG
jgi:hypothetical protein